MLEEWKLIKNGFYVYNSFLQKKIFIGCVFHSLLGDLKAKYSILCFNPSPVAANCFYGYASKDNWLPILFDQSSEKRKS